MRTSKFLYFFPLLVNWIWLSNRSLFIDEFRSFHTISGGIAAVFERFSQSGLVTPLYYLFPWMSAEIFGSTEAALRWPSLVFVVLSAFFLFRIARFFFGDRVAVLACLIFVAAEEIFFASALARPYGLVLMFTTGSIWMLIQWRESNQLRHQLGFILLSALLVYAHPLSILLYPVSLLFMVVEDQKLLRIRWPSIVVSWISIFLLLLPLASPFLTLVGYRSTFNWLGRPSWLEFIYMLSRPMPIAAALVLLSILSFQAPLRRFENTSLVGGYVACLAVLLLAHPFYWFLILLHGMAFALSGKPRSMSDNRGVILALISLSLIGFFLYWRRDAVWLPWKTSFLPTWETVNHFRGDFFGAYRTVAAGLGIFSILLLAPPWKNRTDSHRIIFFVGWAFLPISASFLISYFSDTHLFLSRYYIVWFPGVAIALAVILNKLNRPVLLSVFSVFLILGSIGRSQLGWNPYTQQDWRSAIRFANSLSQDKEAAIVLSTQFVEGSNLGWLQDPTLRQHLLSPVEYYPISDSVLLFPSVFGKPDLQPYLDTLAKEVHGRSTVILITSWLSEGAMQWFRQEMGFPNVRTEIHPFRGVWVVSFSQTGNSPETRNPRNESVLSMKS